MRSEKNGKSVYIECEQLCEVKINEIAWLNQKNFYMNSILYVE